MSDEGGVAAVDRALSILDALTDDKVTLAELSKRTDLYKSTVLRLLKSLEKFGYVLRSADGSYRLGSKVLHLGSLYQRHFKHLRNRPAGARAAQRRGARRRVVLRLRGRQAGLPASRRGEPRGARFDPRRRPPAAHGGRRRPRAARLQRRRAASASTRSAAGCTPPRSASATPRPRRSPRRCSARATRSSARSASPGRATGSRPPARRRIVPILFKYAKELTRTFGGNVDDPTLAGWNLPRAAGRGSAKTKTADAARRA